MKRCVVVIRSSGDAISACSGKGIPTVSFPSMATMAAILSKDNQALLRVIRDAKPKTLTTQQTFDRLQAEIAALKAKHAAIRKANAALLLATLQRVFAA